VYSAKIETIDPDYGYIVFDGTTKQVITVVTGVDVQKVQLRHDATGATLTYNANNATIESSTLEDGTPVLVWTIERLFARDTYTYSIYTRSVLGLNDSGEDLSFKVDAPSDDKVLVSADVAVNDDGTDTFTVVTQTNVSKVKFTDVASGATITVPKAGTEKAKVAIAENEDGKTMTWTITVNHHGGTTFDCQALLGNTYTGAKQVTVPADVEAALLNSVSNAVADGNIVFTVNTREDVTKVRLTNLSANATLTAVPGGTAKIAVSIASNGDGTSTWTITVKYAESYVSEYTCQAFIGSTASDVLSTTVEKA
jgi:hypothetical protein